MGRCKTNTIVFSPEADTHSVMKIEQDVPATYLIHRNFRADKFSHRTSKIKKDRTLIIGVHV